MTLSPGAREIGEALAECAPGEVLAIVIPNQRQDDRRRAIDYYERVLGELRAHGWELATDLVAKPDAEALTLEPIRRVRDDEQS